MLGLPTTRAQAISCPLEKKKKESPKKKVDVCWACFRPGHLRDDFPDWRARFGLSGYANPAPVAKVEALQPKEEAKGLLLGLCLS